MIQITGNSTVKILFSADEILDEFWIHFLRVNLPDSFEGECVGAISVLYMTA